MGRLLKLFFSFLGFGSVMIVVPILYLNKVNVFYVRKEKWNTIFYPLDFTASMTAINDCNEPLAKPIQLIPRTPTTKNFTNRKFIEMKFGPVLIFGAVGGNSSDSKQWDHFKIYGMLDRKLYGKSNLTCCFMYVQRNYTAIKSVKPFGKRKFPVSASMWNFYVACPNYIYNGAIPQGMAVTTDNYTCCENHVTYVQPYFPVKEQNKIAIGTKTAYGNIDPEIIIEWMEAYKYLGVDKIVTYYLKSLNADALKVLNYYASTGFLDLSYYEPANEAKYPRTEGYMHKPQGWNDQATVVDDSFERMSGYRYFGIIDHDEFFIPGKHRTLMDMLRQLERFYWNAAGFVLLSQYYILSWGKYSNNSDMILGSYTRRENKKPYADNNKNFYMPSRVALGGVDTHVISAAKGYKMFTLQPHHGYVRHFRKCRPGEKPLEKCMNKTERVFDDEVAKWCQGFSDSARKVRKAVFGVP